MLKRDAGFGKAVKLFLDGELAGVKKASGDIKRTIHPVTIGKNHERDAENQPGFISNSVFDDVRIYKKAIAPEKSGYYSQHIKRAPCAGSFYFEINSFRNTVANIRKIGSVSEPLINVIISFFHFRVA